MTEIAATKYAAIFRQDNFFYKTYSDRKQLKSLARDGTANSYAFLLSELIFCRFHISRS